MPMELNILHLYPDLLNLYGDKGNLASLTSRSRWRGIEVTLTLCTKEDSIPDLNLADIIFLGGGPDKAEEMVCNFLKEKRDELSTYIEDGGVLLATCGGFPMLGKEFPTADGLVAGLGILDITSQMAEGRYIGNVVLESSIGKQPVVGFENRIGKTMIGNYQPLGKVVCGHGNTGDGTLEGLVYKNVIATHLHGPLLPKNPELCDELLTRALKRKYPKFEGLEPLDDSLESLANQHIVTEFAKK